MIMISKKLEEYIEKNIQEESDILTQLNRETNISVLRARMISGHLQGRILSMLSKMIKPSRILEIGTYTGYSSLCLAEGLTNDGLLITLEKEPELENIIMKYFNLSDYSNKIKLIIGDAKSEINALNETFDIVFIDGDKQDYVEFYNLVFPKVKAGGYIIADNILWSGKVIEEVSPNDKDTKAILEFNTLIKNDIRVENVILPVRDGLSIIRKIY